MTRPLFLIPGIGSATTDQGRHCLSITAYAVVFRLFNRGIACYPEIQRQLALLPQPVSEHAIPEATQPWFIDRVKSVSSVYSSDPVSGI